MVEKWLSSSRAVDIQTLIYISSAYVSMYDRGEIPESLLVAFEAAVKANALAIEPEQAVMLVQILG